MFGFLGVCVFYPLPYTLAMILTFTGSSGTGKTTIEKALLERLPNARPLMSVTTRTARSTDLPGDFLHVTPEVFQQMEERGEFLWTAAVGTTHYGTQTSALREALEQPKTFWIMILVPERVPNVHAFAQQMGREADVRSFYILNPSDDILRQRMTERGDAVEHIEERMQACKEFQERAKASGMPFIWIEDRNDLEKKIRMVTSAITQTPQ